MTRNTIILVLTAVAAAGAIAVAAPASNTSTSPREAAIETRPVAAGNVCEDKHIGDTFGGDAAGCREYLDACLDELTPQQRIEWSRSVEGCLADSSTPFFSCYAQVPWC